MKLDKKGISMVEIMVSIVLISVVLIFLMNLFISVRNAYNQNKIHSEYNMLASNIINAIGKDIEQYNLKEIQKIDNKTVVFTFNSFRKTNLSENIQKILKLYNDSNTYYLSYGYVQCPVSGTIEGCTNNITNEEHITNVVRKMPEGAIIDDFEDSMLDTASKDSIKIRVPIMDQKGNVYDINIFGVLEG